MGISSQGMVPKILVIFLGGYWFISAGVAAWIGRQKGRMIEGLGLGILMGPIGPILVALLPEVRKAAAVVPHHERHGAEPHEHEWEEHHGGHRAHALPVAEVDYDAHHHVGHEDAGAHAGHDERELSRAERSYDAEDDFREDRGGEARTERRLRIDWLWVIFYGGWSLFVVFCWLWLLVYV